jgi:hypothetical protein
LSYLDALARGQDPYAAAQTGAAIGAATGPVAQCTSPIISPSQRAAGLISIILHPERNLAGAFPMAGAGAAIQRWPNTPITLRQGARVIEDSRRLRLAWPDRAAKAGVKLPRTPITTGSDQRERRAGVCPADRLCEQPHSPAILQDLVGKGVQPILLVTRNSEI